MLDGETRTLTLGRSVKADVTVDDEHVAPFHASLQIAPDGGILATDLGTTNGIVVSGKRYRAAQQMALTGGELQVGRTRLRVRTGHEVLPPEKADHLDSAARLHQPAWLAAASLLALAALAIYTSWLGAPQDLLADATKLLGSMALLLALWVFVWALLSRIMRGEWRWLQHIAISAGAIVLYLCADTLFDISAFAFSVPSQDGSLAWLGAAVFGCAVCLHLIHASTLSARSSAQIAAIVALTVLCAGYWWLQRPLSRDVNYIASGIPLFPPSLRLKAAEPADVYFRALASLRDSADKKVQAAIAEDPDPDNFGGGYSLH